MRSVSTTTKVLPRRGTFEGEHYGSGRVMAHESALHVIFSPCGGLPQEHCTRSESPSLESSDFPPSGAVEEAEVRLRY